MGKRLVRCCVLENSVTYIAVRGTYEGHQSSFVGLPVINELLTFGY